MRWVASLFALGVMMALIRRATASGALEARATLALGFLVVAAYLGGALAQRVRLPRITGYLLVGFAVGPPWLGLVRRDEIDALRFIGDAALALIALAAGSELTLETLRRGRTALARLATGAIGFPFLGVTVVMLSVSPWFPLTVHQPPGGKAAVVLVLATVAVVSSPAVGMAMINELDARGPFARALLSVAIAQEVAAAMLFAGVLVVAKAATSAGALNFAVAGTALLELGGSLFVGAILGFFLGRYQRAIRRDTAVFLVAVAFLAAEMARLAHLQTMIVALAAGFYLENFSRVEAEPVRRELGRGALPVSLVFFALAGAGLKLGALADFWPWVLLLVGLRVVSLRFGFQWAGRHPSVTPALARAGWLGLIPQAGMALGLAQLARRAFPEWGVSLETLIVAMIGVHEVVGPICLRHALVRAREVTEDAPGPDALEGGGPVVAARGGL